MFRRIGRTAIALGVAARLGIPGGAGAGSLSIHPAVPRPPERASEAPQGDEGRPVPTDPRIGGRPEEWWREQAQAFARDAGTSGEVLARCEERAAPLLYGDVAGLVARRRRDGRLYFVAIERCNDERDRDAAARQALADFEERARRLGVPPGWLR